MIHTNKKREHLAGKFALENSHRGKFRNVKDNMNMHNINYPCVDPTRLEMSEEGQYAVFAEAMKLNKNNQERAKDKGEIKGIPNGNMNE